MQQERVKLAWSFLSDAYVSAKCLRARPEVLAAACLLLAGEVCNTLSPVTDGGGALVDQRMCDALGVDLSEVSATAMWIGQIACSDDYYIES